MRERGRRRRGARADQHLVEDAPVRLRHGQPEQPGHGRRDIDIARRAREHQPFAEARPARDQRVVDVGDAKAAVHPALTAGALELDAGLALDRHRLVAGEGDDDVGLAVVAPGGVLQIGVGHREGAGDRAVAAVDEDRAIFLAPLQDADKLLDQRRVVARNVEIVGAAVRGDHHRVGGQRSRRGHLEARDRRGQRRADRLVFGVDRAAQRAGHVAADRHRRLPAGVEPVHRAGRAAVAVIGLDAAIGKQVGGADVAGERIAARARRAEHRRAGAAGRAVDGRAVRGGRRRSDRAQRVQRQRPRHGRVRVVGYDDDVGRPVEFLRLERRHQLAEPRVLRPQPRARIGRPRAIAMLDIVRGAEPDQRQHRVLLGQDIAGEDRHHILVRRILRRALGRVGRIPRRDRQLAVRIVGCGVEGDVPGARGRVTVARRQRHVGIVLGGVGGHRDVRRLEFGDEAARLYRVLVDEQPALAEVLDERRARLADRRGRHTRRLRGREQAFHQQQLVAVIVVERVEDRVILGEHRIDIVRRRAARAVADGDRVASALRRRPEGVAVESGRARERSGRERRSVHHGEGRIGRMIVGEVHPRSLHRVEVGSVSRRYVVGA